MDCLAYMMSLNSWIIPGIIVLGYLFFSGKLFDIRDSVYLAFYCKLPAVKCGVIVSLITLCLGIVFLSISITLMGILFTTLFVAIDQATR